MLTIALTTTAVAIGVLALVLAAYALIIYNGFVRLQKNIDRAWSNIDVLLKQRFDEIPALVDSIKGYMEHEKSTLEAVIKARNSYRQNASVEECSAASSAASQALSRLLAVAEDYPQLKAQEQFQSLQARITEIEDHIADRREFYNYTVSIFNTRLRQLPDMLMASLLKLEDRPFFVNQSGSTN